ncbi:MAG: cytochrome C [Bacteroidetes bacterium]|nr:MAG: cytochrome C [Bacteroidota bacterium]
MYRHSVYLHSVALWVLLAGMLGCARHEAEHAGAHSLLHHIQQLPVDTIAYDSSLYHFLDSLAAIEVAGLPQGVPSFYTPRRLHQLNSYPCSNCHDRPLSQLRKEKSPDKKKAHWDILLQHAGEHIMDCNTCHPTQDLDQLQTLKARPLPYDMSYQLCGQCHTSQYKDWQGGAHGKALGGWVTPSLRQTCVGCHNPHKPALEKRWPSRLNTVKLINQSLE